MVISRHHGLKHINIVAAADLLKLLEPEPVDVEGVAV
jgi:hypothetical protein